MTDPQSFQVHVAAANGRPQWIVSLEHMTGARYRDSIDTNSRQSRSRLIGAAAKQFGVRADLLGWLHEELPQRADAADMEADLALGDLQESPKDSTATKLLKLAEGIELFHDDKERSFAQLIVDGAKRVVPTRDHGFKRYLSHQYFTAEGKAPSSNALNDALNVLDGRAFFEGARRDVHVRIAELDGRVYIDLCNDAWQVVEIDAEGWRVLDESPVLFRRTKAMKPLPVPVPKPGASMDQLYDHINVTVDDWPLVAGWLVGAFRPSGPYPILCVYAEQGSAKSTTCRMLRELIDPNAAPLRCGPREPRDLAISAGNAWVLALDNLSNIQPWLSDAFCRMATGGGFSTRTLYANDEEQIFDAQRPVIINGIEDLANRSDLLDRAVIINPPRINGEQRLTEKEVWRKFREGIDGTFGTVVTAVSEALRSFDSTTLDEAPRMADFAKWVCAAEPALDVAPGQFLARYTQNRDEGNAAALEANPIAAPIVELINETQETPLFWQGTATELLHSLEQIVDERTKASRGWPKDGRSIRNTLRRIAPNLRAAGVNVELHGKTNGVRLVTIDGREQCR